MKRQPQAVQDLFLSCPPAPPSPLKKVPLDRMTKPQLRAWIAQTREALMRKVKRERDYLDRRAKRGRH